MNNSLCDIAFLPIKVAKAVKELCAQCRNLCQYKNGTVYELTVLCTRRWDTWTERSLVFYSTELDDAWQTPLCRTINIHTAIGENSQLYLVGFDYLQEGNAYSVKAQNAIWDDEDARAFCQSA